MQTYPDGHPFLVCACAGDVAVVPSNSKALKENKLEPIEFKSFIKFLAIVYLNLQLKIELQIPRITKID